MKKTLNKVSLQFPNIYRFIPESKIAKYIFKSKLFEYMFLLSIFALSLILLISISLVSIRIYKNINISYTLTQERKVMESRVNFWESITREYKGYKDAFFKIAVYRYELGDYNQSKIANNKALLLDPNFEDAKRLQKLLINK